MKLLVCYKLVLDEQDITIQNDGSLNTSNADSKVNPFDLNAIETAMQISEQIEGSRVIALSIGGKALENSKARKDVLSRGPHELTLVIDEQLENVLPHASAKALAASSQKLGFDLIICGDGSGDLYAQQTGILLGEMLQVPVLNGVSKVVSVKPASMIVERTLEDEVEVYEVELPAVICVTTDINVPKIPAMKSILAAAKKPVTTWSAADIGYAAAAKLVELVGIKAPERKERKKIIVEGDGDDQIAAFVEHLRKAMN